MQEIAVSNLPESVTYADLLALFSQYGEVASARVVSTPGTPVDKRVAYVEMPPNFAQMAIEGLNGYHFRTRELAVSSTGKSRSQSGKPQKPIRGGANAAFARHA